MNLIKSVKDVIQAIDSKIKFGRNVDDFFNKKKYMLKMNMSQICMDNFKEENYQRFVKYVEDFDTIVNGIEEFGKRSEFCYDVTPSELIELGDKPAYTVQRVDLLGGTETFYLINRSPEFIKILKARKA